MVDNAAGDDVESKPAKNEASGDASGEDSGDVKPTVNVKPFKVKIPFETRIGKIEDPLFYWLCPKWVVYVRHISQSEVLHHLIHIPISCVFT